MKIGYDNVLRLSSEGETQPFLVKYYNTRTGYLPKFLFSTDTYIETDEIWFERQIFIVKYKRLFVGGNLLEVFMEVK
jgi:hypothetical protein